MKRSIFCQEKRRITVEGDNIDKIRDKNNAPNDLHDLNNHSYQRSITHLQTIQ